MKINNCVPIHKVAVACLNSSSQKVGLNESPVNYPLPKGEGASGFSECANDVGLISSPPV